MARTDFDRYPFVDQDFVVRKARLHQDDPRSPYVWNFITWYEIDGVKTKATGQGFATKAEATSKAHWAFYGLQFDAEVLHYTGPLDVPDDATCVDCGKSIHYKTYDLGGSERCPSLGYEWSHRVNRSDLDDWKHQVNVAATKAALTVSQDA